MHRTFKSRDCWSWMAGLVALTLASCNCGTSAPVPVINSFTASPSHIAPGGSATLAWYVMDATSLSIDNGVGTVTGSSVAVTPAATTTYTLTATNAEGAVTSATTVTVTTAPLPVISSYTASPPDIAPGASSTLAWSVSGATSLSIDKGVGIVTGTSVSVTPTRTTTYTLTATNDAGAVSHSTTVTVTPVPVPVIASFTATPATIARGASSTLAWSVTGATSLSIDNGVGTVTGTSIPVTPAATTTYTLTVSNAGGPATTTTTVTIPAPTALLASATGGPGFLGEVTQFPITVSGAATTFHAFAGKPWIDNTGAMDGQGLVWNAVDETFYGVLNGGGAWWTGVLVQFDPATDALVLLKTLSGRTYPARPGLNGDMFPFETLTGFYRRPLLTPDGKGLLLLSTDGGVSMEGVLVHVNIDPASAKYLTETVVYDFFDYEVGQGSYCKSIRVANLSGQTEMVWGKDGSGNDAIFMARVGETYEVRPENPPNEPGICNPWVFEGRPMDKIYGRMFALRPTDPSDLSKPWAYALGYDDPSRPGQGPVDPLLTMGRQIYWDSYGFGLYPPAVRWTTSGPGSGGQMYFFKAGNQLGTGSYWEVQHRAYDPGGMVPLDTFGNSAVLYSGLHGSVDPLIPDSPPRIFTYTRGDILTQQAALNGWWTDFKRFRGANMSLLSRRLFANGGDESDCLSGSTIPCVPSTIEEMDPAIGYPQRVLVAANEATTGQYFYGDPGVGGSVGEPIADRYVVWFGTQRLGFSSTLNKYDRVTGNTTTITFDPVEGAYPKGRLLDLGNGTALGFADMTVPTIRAGKYGYVGGPGASGAGPGFYVLDLGTGAIQSWVRYTAASLVRFLDFSPEAVRLDDGSLWTALDYRDLFSIPAQDYRIISRLNTSTGTFTTLLQKEETWNYTPFDVFVPAGRKSAAIYLPFWQSSVTPFSDHLVNATLGCVRADAGTVNAQSLVFGPASAASGNANRIVYGATYSPVNDAMYLATSKVANADQGTIFEVDKGVADASLCRAAPVVTALVTGLTDVPSTKPLSTRAGALFYGTSNGKLMRLNVSARTVTEIADLKGTGSTSSQVKGYLAETADGVVVAVVFDYDSSGKNTARRLVSVEVATGAKTSRDVTALIEEWEPYPGVMRLN
jgi:PKD repeat protein